ncbi:MAG: hypothetical protein PHI50_03900 [Alphaproteobacteria bacterium]|nr:hypothetical protein [Alphaproteobacteria bacterium]
MLGLKQTFLKGYDLFLDFLDDFFFPFFRSKYAFFLGLILLSLISFLFHEFFECFFNFEFISYALSFLIFLIALFKKNGGIFFINFLCFITHLLFSYLFNEGPANDVIWTIFFPFLCIIFPLNFCIKNSFAYNENALYFIKKTFSFLVFESLFVFFIIFLWPVFLPLSEAINYQKVLIALLKAPLFGIGFENTTLIPPLAFLCFLGTALCLLFKEIFWDTLINLSFLTTLILCFFAFLSVKDITAFSLFFTFAFLALAIPLFQKES